MNLFFLPENKNFLLAGKKQLLKLFLIILCLFFCGPVYSAVSRVDLESEAQKARVIYNDFMSEMLYARISAHYSGFIASDELRKKSAAVCDKSKGELFEVYSRQNQMLKEVEEYEGDNWYEIYGESGLWKAAKRYPEQTKGYIEFVKVYQEYCRLVRGDDIQRVVDKELGLLRKYSLKERIEVLEGYYDSWVEGEGERLADEFIAGGEFEGSVLLGLKLCRAGYFEYFEKAGSKFGPEKVEWLGGSVVFDDLMNAADDDGVDFVDFVEDKSVYEVSLAFKFRAFESGELKVGEYEMMSRVPAIEKFQKRSVYFYFAEAVKDYKPYKGLEGYLLSIQSDGELKGSRIYVSRERAAKEAAVLAYKGYQENVMELDSARKALGYYIRLSDGEDRDRFEYVYAGLELEAGNIAEAMEILEKLAGRGGELSVRARLDIAAMGLDENSSDENWLERAGKEVKEIIEEAKGPKDAQQRLRAVRIYCAILLEKKGDDYRGEVLRVISENGFEDELVGQAVWAMVDLGRYEEAADRLSRAVGEGKEELKDECEYLVYAVNCRLEEEIITAKRGEQFVKNLDKCAAFTGGAGLAEVKLMILAQRKGWEKTAGRRLQVYEDKYGGQDLEYLKCRGFYEEKKGNWDQAVKVWSRVCGGGDFGNQWQQQGKYHQLYCSWRGGLVQPDELKRIVDVLMSVHGEDFNEPWKGLIGELGAAGLKSGEKR